MRFEKLVALQGFLGRVTLICYEKNIPNFLF